MSENKYPAGSWYWMNSTLLGKGTKVILMPGKNNTLATCGSNGMLEKLTPEHPISKLIEAAPDLLDACENMIDAINADQTIGGEIELIEKAISKAKGEHDEKN